jgi:hypothetical protein
MSASMMRTTWSVPMRTGARASVRKRSTAWVLEASAGFRTLRASDSPVLTWWTA